MKREQLLMNAWSQTICSLPRQKAEGILRELGFSPSMYRQLEDEQVRKLLFGFMTRLDQQTLEGIIHMVQE